METVVIPKYEYVSMKEQIAELQKKMTFLQDPDFMLKMKAFVELFFFKENKKKQADSSVVPFKFGAAKGLISISDDFNLPLAEFNEYL